MSAAATARVTYCLVKPPPIESIAVPTASSTVASLSGASKVPRECNCRHASRVAASPVALSRQKVRA